MANRMDRYMNTGVSNNRVEKNRGLYDSVYQEGHYKSVDDKDLEPKTQVIDINQIRELISKNSDGGRIIRERREVIIPEESEPENHDINDILNKSKEEREITDNDYRSLKNTAILRSLQMELKHGERFQEEEAELKELIQTITCNSELNKLNNKELSLDMLDDLKGNESTAVNKVIKEEVEEAKEEKLDNSFYTSSLDFNKEDFDKINNLGTEVKKNNKLIKVILFILAGMIIGAAVMMVINFL